MRRWVALAALGLSAVPMVFAQPGTVKDTAFLRAALIVLGHDLLATRCTQSSQFTSAEDDSIARWSSTNAIPLVRDRITALEHDPANRVIFDRSRTYFLQHLTPLQNRKACTGALTFVGRPDAQLATMAPDLLRALRAQTGDARPTSGAVSAAPPATAAPPSAAPSPLRSSAAAAELIRRIDRFGFDNRTVMGMGGFIGLDIYPVVLFRDGSALTEIEGLGFAGGLDAHRRAHADDWTRWRRVGSEIQLEDKGKWEKLAFRATYSTLPPDFRLNGVFRRNTGVGNVAMGGTAAVMVEREYLFSRDGRVVRGGTAGSSATGGDISVVTSHVAPNRRGRYTIDGITLQIRYDDGSEERRILVTDPTDPKSVIWLDGEGYVRP